MFIARDKRPVVWLLILLLGSFAGGACLAQDLLGATGNGEEEEDTAEPTMPELGSLREDWWAYFEGPQETVNARVEAFLSRMDEQIDELAPQNQQIATDILEATRDNFDVYQSLLEPPDLDEVPFPEPAAAYTIDELLATAAQARKARREADDELAEVEREERVLSGVTRRRDATFKDYLDAAPGDERWLDGLRLVRVRSSQAVAMRRLAILQKSADYAIRYADRLEERVELILERLAPTANQDELDTLSEATAEAANAVAARENATREAQTAASGLEVDSVEGRYEQRLQEQRALDAEVELAIARVTLALAEARRFATELELDRDVDIAVVEDAALEWSELQRFVEEEIDAWERNTEDELLEVQTIGRDDLSRESRRILDQRTGTAQETLADIAELRSGVADLGLLTRALDNAIADYSGGLRLWLSNAGNAARSAWNRVDEVTGSTLFSVGDTPVTFGDIVQAFIILLIGWALSRGIRMAIRRVGQKESIGRQAALYTVSRLTHYAIIILAFLIALSSIGLDFTSLALVAGALSVGIGFGLQSIVNNFVSGLIILFERTLRVGDYIELDNGLTGTVKAINVRSTLINTNDNIDIVVPNSEFVTNRLTNWTLAEHILRMRIPFGVAYGSDKELVKKAAMEACEGITYTLTHMPGREPDVWLVEYGDNSLNFLLLVWVNRQGARRPTRTRATYLWELETKLREYGIEIPFPQRDLHLRSGWPPPDASGQASPPAEAPEPAD
ncbi:MAG: mechanosensitive ion channel [Woeseiaceae bacterium]